MSNINFKELAKDCVNYKTKRLVNALSSTENEGGLHSFLEYQVKNFKNFQMHDFNKREKRNVFLESIIKNCSSQEIIDLTKKVLTICQISETLLDGIKDGLHNLEIMKKSVREQCWSVISHALDEGYFLQDLIEKNIQNFDFKESMLTTNARNIKNAEGKSFSPDSALDKIVNYLTLTLKMFSYENKLCKGDVIVLPENIAMVEEDIKKAIPVFYYALIWNELLTCTKSCIYFDNELLTMESKQIPEDYKREGIESVVVFDRTIDSLERYDVISNERLSRKISQNFWEGVAKHNLEENLLKDITEWPGKIDHRMVILEELPALVSLFDVISSNDVNTVVLGLTIREWVRGYSVITYIAKNNKKKTHYSHSALVGILRLGGLSESSAETFIDKLTFSMKSRDIYDSPLIKIEDDSYVLFTPAYTSPLISNIILSKFASEEADLTAKGYGFEKDIISTLEEYGLNVKKFKFTRDKEEYEYDALFLLDDKLFVLECKNTNLSSGSVTRAYQRKKFLFETTYQVKRLVKGLKLYPEIFKEYFGFDLHNYEIIPVIMNNLPHSIPGKINDIYVTDSSSFSRLIKSKYINATMISHEERFKMSESRAIINQWEGEVLSAMDIIRSFEEPVQVNDFKKHEKVNVYPLQVDRERVFINKIIETDYDSMVTEQNTILKSLR
ncbi:TPA: hypothetical protein ACOEAQ_002657 [Enterobacter asburiae]